MKLFPTKGLKFANKDITLDETYELIDAIMKKVEKLNFLYDDIRRIC